jgi:hypothetical protein
VTIEEEIRAFADKYIPNGAMYISSTPVPHFDGHTWEEVLEGKYPVPPAKQKAVLRRLHDLFGSRGK